MKFRSNNTRPKTVPQILKARPPTLATKTSLDPMLLDLMGTVNEKKFDKPDKMRISH